MEHGSSDSRGVECKYCDCLSAGVAYHADFDEGQAGMGSGWSVAPGDSILFDGVCGVVDGRKYRYRCPNYGHGIPALSGILGRSRDTESV